MSLSGHLRTMAAGNLFQWLSFSQKTGKLAVSNGEVEKTIFINKGKIVTSASTDPREYLGQFLMSYGYITEDELKKAMEVQQQSRILLGKILVVIEAISEDDLRRLMRRKAEEEIYDVFLWKDGEFVFQDDEKPAMELVPLNLDITGVIMEGSRRMDEWERIRAVVTDSAAIPVRNGGELDLSGFNEAQKKIAELIDGRRSVDAIVLESRSSTFLVSKTIWELVGSGTVRLEQAVQAEAPPSAAPPSAPLPADDFLGSDAEIASLLTRAQAGLRGGEYEKALRLLKAAQNLDPENPKVRSALKGAEAVVVGELKNRGITDHKVPSLRQPLEELSGMNFTPNEGFILSRINGQWDVNAIAKISPMREIDALLIFHKLIEQQIVDLR